MTRRPDTDFRTVLDMFRDRVERAAAATAVIDGPARHSYAEIDRRSARLAAAMQAHGLRRGGLVAVLLDNSVGLVVAILAAMKAGGCYLPLNPADPAPRIGAIVADADPAVIVAPHGSRVAGCSAPLLDPATESRGDRADFALSAGDAAYTIYTSGSTGTPKGVVVEHGALAAYLDAAAAACPGLDGHVPAHSSPSFDFAVTCLLGPLVCGGTVVIASPAESAPDAEYSFVKVTPAHLRLMADHLPHWSPRTTLMVAGEALTESALRDWRARHPDVCVVNEYGPTETTVGCCLHLVPAGQRLESGPVPIGTPVPGSAVHVLDDALRPAETGELYVAGAQLARGYLGRSGATAAAFVADPFDPGGTRMYRTGDIVRLRPDGALEYVGRADNQLSIGGFRVEPEEVAAQLTHMDDVAAAAVVAQTYDANARRLVAFVVPRAGREPAPAALRARMADRVPAHMVPARIVVVAELPLNGNGKVDMAALRLPADEQAAPADEPADPSEATVCRLVADIVGVEAVGPDDDFFGIGGTSLDAARLVTHARRHAILFTLPDVLRKRTVRRLLADSPHPIAHDRNRNV